MKGHILPALGIGFALSLTGLAVRSVTENQQRVADGLAALESRVADLRANARADASALGARLDRLEASLSDVARHDDLGTLRDDLAALRVALSSVEASAAERCDRLEARLDRVAEDFAKEMARARPRPPDVAALAAGVLQPSVQVSARGGIGGGTIVYSAREGEGPFATFVVTAFHVVNKALTKDEADRDVRLPVDVKVYRVGGELDETVKSDLVAYDDRRDIALLKLRSSKAFPAAKLMPRERLRALGVFTPVYAVGCPLGHAPLPSPGEISMLQKDVNGERFWMMNAPTIFGNSGGGVFHRETHELVGVSAMICTFDNPVTTPVPHLGILVPLEAVYDWLADQHYQFLFDAKTSRSECERARRGALARARVEW